MDPGLFFGGVIAGLLIAQAWVADGESTPSSHRGPPVHPKVAKAQQLFLPHAQETIRTIVATEPEAASSWRTMSARIPYLTEAVAMYYAMEDPNVPMAPKLSIAGSLLYLVSPLDIIPDTIPVVGQVDDLAVLYAALQYVYGHINQLHMERARAWLAAQGIDPKPLFAIGKDLSELPEATVQAQNQQQLLPFPSAPALQLPGSTPHLLPGPTTQGPQGPQPPTGFGSYHDDQPPAPPPRW